MDNEIIEAIETKGRLASGYDWRGATEKWLLLVAEGHGLTDVIGDVQQIALPPAPKSSPFTSILVWDKFSEDIWAVFPEFALMCDGSHQVRHVCSLPAAVQAFATEGEHYPTRRKAR